MANTTSSGAKKIGLMGAIFLVMSNVMSSGISLLPANMAAIGSITIISWFLVVFGALALAYVFAKLGLKDPETGGLVAYAEQLSPALGHQTGLLYWLSNWIGNLGTTITGVVYLSVIFNQLIDPIAAGIVTIALVWIFTIINYFGVDKIVKISSVTIVLLMIPIICTAIFGWFHFSTQTFVMNWNVSGESHSTAIFSGILLAIWSFIGIESASVDSDAIQNPKRNVPLATMIGTAFAGLVYITSTTVISGMYPASIMEHSGAPFALTFGALVGGWSKPLVSIVTAAACLASLGTWIMVVGQAGVAAANNGILPKIFAKKTKRDIPAWGITLNSILMTILMVVLMFLGGKTSTAVFGYIVSISVLLIILPYFYSCLQLIRITGLSKKTIIPIVISLMACIFCFVALIGAKKIPLIGFLITSLICFIFYAVVLSKKLPPKNLDKL
jgi:cadaverine:lysine antiporter